MGIRGLRGGLAMRFSTIPLALILLSSAAVFAQKAATETHLTVEGHVFCVGDSGARPATVACSGKGERSALKDADGRLHIFSPEDPRALILEDKRVFRRRLRIEGIERDGHLLITDLHAVEDGRLVRLYYHCDVCNIDSYAPGPCWCCQRPFEFREEATPPPGSDHVKPLKQKYLHKF